MISHCVSGNPITIEERNSALNTSVSFVSLVIEIAWMIFLWKLEIWESSTVGIFKWHENTCSITVLQKHPILSPTAGSNNSLENDFFLGCHLR